MSKQSPAPTDALSDPCPPAAGPVTLGVDPSVTSTGYAVMKGERLVAAGCIETSPDAPEPVRIAIILGQVLALVHEHGVTAIAVENFTAFYRSARRSRPDPSLPPLLAVRAQVRRGEHDHGQINPASMFLMKAAQTAVLIAAALSHLPLFAYGVAEWKGGPRVSKKQTLHRVRLIYGLDLANDNIADAIMIAHHHRTVGHRDPARGVTVTPEELPFQAVSIPTA